MTVPDDDKTEEIPLVIKWSPVKKPGDKFMPLCKGCKKRPVSDARKPDCGRCGRTYTTYSSTSSQGDVDRIERMFCGH